MITLSQVDVELFSKIWTAILIFTNDEKHIVKDFGHPQYYEEFNEEDAYKIAKELWADDSIIDRFIKARPNVPKLWKKILKSWQQYHIEGTFLVMRQYKDFATLYDEKNSCIWGVTGIFFPVAHFCDYMPFTVNTTLLPFKDAIIYDSLMEGYRVHIQGNMRKHIMLEYNELLKKDGVRRSFDGSINNLPGAWLRDDDDITEEFVEENEDDEKPMEMPAAMKEQIEKLLAENPGASLDTLNQKMQKIAEKQNDTGLERFDGLSPNQMDYLFNNPKDSAWLVLKPGSGKAGEKCPVIKEIRYFLEKVKMAGFIKLTQAGYLTPAFVAEMNDIDFSAKTQMEILTEKYLPKIPKENDVRHVRLVRKLCELAGFIAVKDRKMQITEKAENCLQENKLFPVIFNAYCKDFIWTSLGNPHTPFFNSDIGHDYYAYIFYLLSKYGDKKRPASFYMDKYYSVFFKTSKKEKSDNGEENEMIFKIMHANMFFDDFLHVFGFTDIEYDDFWEVDTVKLTALFHECIEVKPGTQ
jgi:hypothetical protein